jgi:hypothetical protein
MAQDSLEESNRKSASTSYNKIGITVKLLAYVAFYKWHPRHPVPLVDSIIHLGISSCIPFLQYLIRSILETVNLPFYHWKAKPEQPASEWLENTVVPSLSQCREFLTFEYKLCTDISVSQTKG